MQYQIEIRLRHGLIFFEISASGYLVDRLDPCTVKQIIQLTVIHKRREKSQKIDDISFLFCRLKKRI